MRFYEFKLHQISRSWEWVEPTGFGDHNILGKLKFSESGHDLLFGSTAMNSLQVYEEMYLQEIMVQITKVYVISF